jgi:Ca-activated chloride channel homolog
VTDSWVSFERPAALLLLAALPVLGALYIALLVARRRALHAFGGPGSGLVSASLPLQVARNLLRLMGLAALIVLVAGPLLGRPLERRDVVVLLDVSHSMGVQDVTPSRIALARTVIDYLAATFGEHRIGLVYFGGDARMRFPLTDDPPAIGKVLDLAAYPFVPITGSSLDAGLRAAVDVFPPEVRAYGRPKSLVVLSDGAGGAGLTSVVGALRSEDVRVFVVGIGTADGGRVPLYAENGQFLRYLTGPDGPTISSLEPDRLEELAGATGGRYWAYTGGEPVAQEIAAQILNLPATEVTGERWVVDERRRWLLLVIALGVLLLEAVLPERRRMPTPAVAL